MSFARFPVITFLRTHGFLVPMFFHLPKSAKGFSATLAHPTSPIQLMLRFAEKFEV